MSKINLIVQREYISRITKKSFIILTLLVPILSLGVTLAPLWIASITNQGGTVRQVAVVDQTGKYEMLFADNERYKFVRITQSPADYRHHPDKTIFAVLHITDDLLKHPQAATLYSDQQIPNDLLRTVNQIISKQLEHDKIASYQIPQLDEIIKQSKVNFDIQTVKWNQDGSELQSSTTIAFSIGIASVIGVYIFIILYGSMLMQAVLEEKTSRIVEIIVSSVKPFQLMMGKIIGIGLVGLTQFALWILIGVVLLQGTILGLDLSILVNNQDITQMTNTPTLATNFDYDTVLEQLQSFNFGEIIVAFILYFVGGYLLYGAFFTAIGAAVDTPEDAQPFMTPMIIVIVFTMMFTLQNAESANGTLTLWGSMIPFTAPFMMLARIPFGVPTIQLIVSLVILYATALFAIYAAGKIYRIGILRYGSKLSLKNILKRIVTY